MKPSLYFADQFKFFFKRFLNEENLFKWFAKQSGGETGAFSFPECLADKPKTLIILPRDKRLATEFVQALPAAFYPFTLFCGHESIQPLIAVKKAKAFYYNDRECRYGENFYTDLQQSIKRFNPQVCIYLGQPFLPRLFLAKISGAPCRIGFDVEQCYPFLNLSLKPEKLSKAELLCEYYGIK